MTVPQLILALEPYSKQPSTPAVRTAPPRIFANRSTVLTKRSFDDLPWSYGETEVVLMAVDPFLVHAYWDFSPGDWEKVRHRGQPVALRIYDVTMIRFDGTNAHSHFDVPVGGDAQNWYVRLWTAEKSLCADLGWPRPGGSFETLVRSNVIQTPRAGVSIYDEVRWVEVRWSRRRPSLLIQRKRPGTGMRPAFWPALEEQAAGRTGGSAGSLSSRAIGTKSPNNTPA